MRRFNVDKTIGACLRIIEKAGFNNSISHKKLLKLLYMIDRTMLTISGEPLTNDTYEAWKEGPVLTTTYALITNRGPHTDRAQEYFEKWNNYFLVSNKDTETGKTFLTCKSVSDIKTQNLSEEDIYAVDAICNDFGHYTDTELVEWIHESFFEWEDVYKPDKNIEITIEDIKKNIFNFN